MRVDWQRYIDGVLTPEEMAVADGLLRSDPSARRELEGLKEFKRVLRESALREPVPTKRLNRALTLATGRGERQRPILRPALLAFGLLAASALAVLFALNYDSNPYDLPPTKHERFTSATAAHAWAEEETGIKLLFVDLAPMGRTVGAHTNGASACFDFDVDGELVHVQVTNAKFNTKGCKIVPTDDGNVLIHEKSDTVYLNCGESGYIVYGSDAQTGVAIGKALLRNCPTNGS